MDSTKTTAIVSSEQAVAQQTTHSEQPVEIPRPDQLPDLQQQLSIGGIAMGTIVCITLLLREIRRLVTACKS